MSFLDWVAGDKLSTILEGVTTLSAWSGGLSKRINVLERRMGAIELALTVKGVKIPPIKEEEESEEPK